jgi:hypothetical protein
LEGVKAIGFFAPSVLHSSASSATVSSARIKGDWIY